MKIFTYNKCSSCRKATQWLTEQGYTFQEVAIRETPPSHAELLQMLAHQQGALAKLFNRSGRDYRALNLKDQLPTLTEDEALQLLTQNGNLVKRPFLLSADFGLLGFKEAEWAQTLAR